MAARNAGETEAGDDRTFGKPVACDAPAHVPHQEAGVQVAALDAHRPSLPPTAERLEYWRQLAAGGRQRIAVTAPFGDARPRDHARLLELPQPPGQQRTRHQRNAKVNLVETFGACQELAHDHGRPALREDLAGHGDGAELAESGSHGRSLAGPRCRHKFTM